MYLQSYNIFQSFLIYRWEASMSQVVTYFFGIYNMHIIYKHTFEHTYVCTYVQSSYIICAVFTVNMFVLTMVALSDNICTPTTNQTSF